MKHFKIGANAVRHVNKHAGSTEQDYIAFAAKTARKVVISRCDQEICEKMNIYTVAHLVHLTLEIPYILSEVEAESYLLEHCENPFQLAKLYLDAQQASFSHFSIEHTIDEYLSTFPKASFERFGDVNFDIHKSWFSEKGLPLDIQLKEIQGVSELLEMDDIIDFVRKYKRNEYVPEPVLLMREVEVRWKELFGFHLKHYYAQHLISMCTYYIVVYNSDEVPF